MAHHIQCLAHVINLAVKAFLSNLKIAQLSKKHEWLTNNDPEESDVDEDSDSTADDDDDIYRDNSNRQDYSDNYVEDLSSFQIDDT